MAEGTWDIHGRYDVDEINDENRSLFEKRYNKDEKIQSVLRADFKKRYDYDIMSGTGPYLAVVLKVLAGPQVKEKTESDGNWLTKTAAHIVRTVVDEFDELTGNSERVRIIARIPSFDADIKFPKDSKDAMRISCHAEFVAISSDSSFKSIKPGSLVFVAYANTDATTGYSGRPSGRLVAVSNPCGFAYIDPRELSEGMHKPKCKASGKLAGPGGGMYVGKTVSDPNKPTGPPISKIKGKIKTGFYGNGTAQTKAHFDQAMRDSLASVKHSVSGPAPGSENAFVWIGNLKNNGYLDLLDRPISQGRETIVYAPMTLDVNSPIEIKYYFHGMSGFGHAWVDGPNTTIDAAVNFTVEPGNDFREKIGPGIKDLIRQGRNFVLVIPELAHSRGYGTGLDDDKRIKDLIAGKKVTTGISEGTSLRASVNSKIRPAVKEYLRSIPIEKQQNLLHITSLLERPYCNFDGSFSGGRFDLFHQEVIDVLSEHLGKIDDKIGYISILADGVGAISLASIVKAIPNSSVHREAEKAFKNVKIDRIDYVVNDNLDTAANNLYFPSTPSYSVYSDYLLGQSGYGKTIEFNYITEKSSNQTNEFFNKLGISNKFKKANKAGSSPGESKFSHAAAPDVFVTMHVSPKDTKRKKSKIGYAFSMSNDTLVALKKAPKKADTSPHHPSHNAVPDHAMAIAASPAASDLARYHKQKQDLAQGIKYFEGIINETVIAHDLLLDGPGFLFDSYLKYLDNKVLYKRAEGLADLEEMLLPMVNDKEALLQALEALDSELDNITSKEPDLLPEEYKLAKEQWKEFRAKFDPDNFKTSQAGSFSAFVADQPGEGYVAEFAHYIARPEVLQVATSKIKNALKKAKPRDRRTDADCVPDIPVSIGTLIAPKISTSAATTPSVIACNDIKIATPTGYNQLVKMIPYYPKKSDFFSSGSKTRTSTKKTNLEMNTPGYRVATFKYKARAIGNATTYYESPPVWSCLAEKIQSDWELACNASGYVPFKITSGIKGSFNQKGVTAYKQGISLHALGLAFDLDPYITGYSEDGDPLYSVYTGFWTPGFVEQYGEELYDLGVIKRADIFSFWDDFLDNVYEDTNRLRLAENWSGANNAYKSWPWNKPHHQKYDKIMTAAKGAPIVPYGANPTLWLLLFCEKTGMKWGNSTFLKKRYRGGNTWSLEEQNRIAAIYGIPDVVPRIYSISWAGNRFDDHMHFQYYNSTKNPGGIVTWKEMEKIQKKLGK